MARCGFTEEPEVLVALDPAARACGRPEEDQMLTTYYLGHDTPVLRRGSRWLARAMMRLFGFLRKNEYSTSLRFGLPPNRVVELGARVEL